MKMKYLIIMIFILISSTYADESDFDGLESKTAEEIELSETFMHESRNQAQADAACADSKDYSDLCTNETLASKSESAQKLEQLMPVVAKIYSMVITVGSKEGDRCGIIAGAVEAGAVVMQGLANQTISKNLEASNTMSTQAQSFYAMSDKHKSLKNQATLQAGGWGATAVCYGFKLAKEIKVPKNVKKILMTSLKLGGAITMGTFYTKKAINHKKRQKQLIDIAKKLPNVGDCNPVTETTCFCAEDTSQTTYPAKYQKYCVAQEFSNRAGKPTSCVTSTGLADPNCNCKLTNSCITSRVGELGIELGFGKSAIQSMIDGIKPLGTGFVSANFQAVSDKNLAFAKKQLKKAPPLKSDPNLSSDQKKTASLLASLGIPKSVAANISKQPSRKLPSSVSTIEPTVRKKRTNAITYNNSPSFKKGGTIRKKKSSSSARNSIFSRKKKSSAGSTGIEIDNYMAKAQREAEITKDTSKPIFDIISYRYKKSAWREFQSNLEENTEKVQK